MNISIAGRPGISRRLEINILAALAAVGLLACGGSGGSPGGGSVGDRDPVKPGDSSVCSAEEYAARWAASTCPDGFICISGVYGTEIQNVVPLVSGRRPDWSPDGQKIAYHRDAGPTYPDGGVFVINTDASGEKMLATGREPAWSPDGRKIAFRNREGIAVMNNDGTGVVTLLGHDFADDERAGVGSPAWSSPDGQSIVFVNHGDGDLTPSRLFIMNSDGSDVRPLIQATSNVRRAEIDPSWSPDGGRIALVNWPDLATIDNTGGNAVVIVPGADRFVSKPGWSPDGSLITYTERVRCAADAVHMVSSEGGATNLLLYGAHDAVWSPDGGRIAFATAADAFPPIAGVAGVYVRETPDSWGNRSRYVLYPNRAFELQFLSYNWGFVSYRGEYTLDEAVFSFSFDGGSTARPWLATGILEGARLSIEYNSNMMLSDFENGVYFLTGSDQ